MTSDAHGYQELCSVLQRVEAELRQASDEATADTVATAQKFAIGSPSEFLGEARIALQSVLASPVRVSDGTREAIERVIKEINEAFRRVGGG